MKKGDKVYLWDGKIICTTIESIKVEEIDGKKRSPKYKIVKHSAALPEWVKGTELFKSKQALVKQRLDEAIKELKEDFNQPASVYYAQYINGILPSKTKSEEEM